MKVAVIYNKTRIETSDVIQVFGMPTKERYNPKTVERVATALEEGGHNVRVIEGNMHVVDEMRNFMPRVLAGERPGIVFNMAYGIQGQSRYTHIPAMLEMLGVPYVGSGPAVHGVALDKVMTKMVLQQRNLSTPGFWVFSSHKDPCDEVIYPVIVKPKMEAVSMGLRVVDNEADLREAVQYIIEEFKQQALVEQFIPGREFAVGLLGNYPNLEVLPIVEIDLKGDPNAIQSFTDKTKQPPGKICPAEISPEITEEMKRLAREAFYALGLFDFARVDLRMDADGRLYILELNSMASLGLTGSYVHAAKVAGYTYGSMVNRMLDVAAVRYFGESVKIPEEEGQPDKPPTFSVQVRGYLRSNLATMEDYLKKMLEINTYVQNVEGVNALSNWIVNRLGQLGFQCEVHPQVEVGNILYCSNHQEEQNDILILGHMDTFYRYQDYVPLREERGRLYGSGVAESKGGLALLLGALQALRFARRLRSVRCGILLTTDDSLGGRFSKKLVEEKARRSKYVVGLKCGEKEGGIVTSCSGRAVYQIEISNVKGEKTAAPDVIPALCQKVLAWQKLSSAEEEVAVTANSLEARTLYGPAPDYAAVSLTIRFKTRTQGEELDKEIRRIAKKDTSRNLRVQAIRGIYRIPHSETDAIKGFFERVQRVARRLDIRVQPAHRFNSSDICYVPDNVPALDGMGPVGGGYRSPNEYILRDTMIDRAALLALVIRSCAREEKK